MISALLNVTKLRIWYWKPFSHEYVKRAESILLKTLEKYCLNHKNTNENEDNNNNNNDYLNYFENGDDDDLLYLLSDDKDNKTAAQILKKLVFQNSTRKKNHF